MLQTQCLFGSPPTIKLCSGKYSHENKVPYFGDYIMHEKSEIRSKKNGNLGVKYYNAHTYLTSIHYPLESKLRLVVKSGGEDSSLAVKSGGEDSGIGIARFYRGKNIFITGGTGLLGKVLVEKLLRSTSVGKIYLLVRANDKEAAFGRLSKEMIESELFECLREKHGKSYEEFVGEKVIPIAGNICEPNLGMDESSMHALMEDVHVIIESGANTTFNGRYDILMDTNVNAPQRLMRLAKRCKNLKLFVHISTAYVNGKREGVIYEKPLVMGENGRNEDGALSLSSFHDGVDIANEINMVVKSCIAASVSSDTTKVLKSLGMERAAFLGWNNTYTLTKAMGEMILNEIRGDVPLLIMRPTIIESSYKEPIPGWIQGIRMSDPVIIAYAKGLLPAYMADPSTHFDIVPVDMLANTIVAAIAKHGVINKPELNVYHVATDFVNPFRASDLFNYTYEHFSANPLKPDAEPIKKMKFFPDISDFSRYISDEFSGMRNSVGIDGRKLQKLQKQCKAKVAYAEQLCKIYEFAAFFKARFHTGNTRKLLEEMSKEERFDFEVDATKIDWRKYFVEIHIPGVRKHLLN